MSNKTTGDKILDRLDTIADELADKVKDKIKEEAEDLGEDVKEEVVTRFGQVRKYLAKNNKVENFLLGLLVLTLTELFHAVRSEYIIIHHLHKLIGG